MNYLLHSNRVQVVVKLSAHDKMAAIFMSSLCALNGLEYFIDNLTIILASTLAHLFLLNVQCLSTRY